MLPRGEVGCRALNDHGNYIIDHGKIMEKSWNFVFEFLWEPCCSRRLQQTTFSDEFFLGALRVKLWMILPEQVIMHCHHERIDCAQKNLLLTFRETL